MDEQAVVSSSIYDHIYVK